MSASLVPPRSPVRRSTLYMSAVAGLALIAAIANSGASVGFPVNTVAERIANAVVTLHLLVMVIILVLAAVMTARREAAAAESGAAAAGTVIVDQSGRGLVGPTRTGVLVVLGTGLAVVLWVIWLVFAFPAVLTGMLAGGSSYLFATTVLAFVGPAWVLATVFAVVGFHRGGDRRNRTLSFVGAGLGVLMMGVSVLLSLLMATGAMA